MSSDEDSLEEPALNKPNVRNITVFDPEQWIEQKLAPRQVNSKQASSTRLLKFM
mgnify:CR=1 FL=1